MAGALPFPSSFEGEATVQRAVVQHGEFLVSVVITSALKPSRKWYIESRSYSPAFAFRAVEEGEDDSAVAPVLMRKEHDTMSVSMYSTFETTQLSNNGTVDSPLLWTICSSLLVFAFSNLEAIDRSSTHERVNIRTILVDELSQRQLANRARDTPYGHCHARLSSLYGEL